MKIMSHNLWHNFIKSKGIRCLNSADMGKQVILKVYKDFYQGVSDVHKSWVKAYFSSGY